MFFNNFFIENTKEELFNDKITYQMTNCLISTCQLTVMVNFYYKALMLRLFNNNEIINLFNFKYLNNKVWIITHQEEELIKKMEQQAHHVIAWN